VTELGSDPDAYTLHVSSIEQSNTAALAVAADIQRRCGDTELAVPSNTLRKVAEHTASEFGEFPTVQAFHSDSVALGRVRARILLSAVWDKAQLADHSVPFQKLQRPVNRDPVDLRVHPLRSPMDHANMGTLGSPFDDAENRAALLCQSHSASQEFSLQITRGLV